MWRGCVLWGCRVVVPGKARKRAMEMLNVAWISPWNGENEVLSPELSMVARDGQRHRRMCQEMRCLSADSERPAGSAITPMGMARQTVDPSPHQLCGAFGEKDFFAHCRRTFQVDRDSRRKFVDVVNHDRTSAEDILITGDT